MAHSWFDPFPFSSFLSFGNLNLFRISSFGFRISPSGPAAPLLHYSITPSLHEHEHEHEHEEEEEKEEEEEYKKQKQPGSFDPGCSLRF